MMTQPMLLELSSPLPPPLRLGEVLGKYRLEQVVASGGMGIVVEATHVQLDQRVAIKFLAPTLSGDEDQVRRFLQEARAAARLGSEHVVRVFDVDTLPTGTPYIVMEFLEGEDLKATLERRGRLPPSEAVEIVLQACEAIAEAHHLGIVHRDLKPGNLFHCKRADRLPFVKVLDFGVSKLLPTSQIAWKDRASTGPHVVMGTPEYASPEQLRSSTEVDTRTDIWALGVILYELLAGDTPFHGNTLLELRARIAYGTPRPIRELRPEVPQELDDLVSRCLAKDKGGRYATVADVAEALAPHGPRSSHISVQRVGNILRKPLSQARTLPSATPIPPSVVSARRPARPSRGARSPFAWVAGASIVGAFLLALWMASEPSTDEPSRPRPAQSAVTELVLPRAPVPAAWTVEANDTASAATASAPTPAPTAPAPATPAFRTPPPRHKPAAGTEKFGGLL